MEENSAKAKLEGFTPDNLFRNARTPPLNIPRPKYHESSSDQYSLLSPLGSLRSSHPTGRSTQRSLNQKEGSSTRRGKLPSLQQYNLEVHRKMVASMESAVDQSVPKRFPMRSEDRRGDLKKKKITKANHHLLKHLVDIQYDNAMEKSLKTEHNHEEILNIMKSNRNHTRKINEQRLAEENSHFYNRLASLRSEYAANNSGKRRGPKIVAKVRRARTPPQQVLTAVYVEPGSGEARVDLVGVVPAPAPGAPARHPRAWAADPGGHTPRYRAEARRHAARLRALAEERAAARARRAAEGGAGGAGEDEEDERGGGGSVASGVSGMTGASSGAAAGRRRPGRRRRRRRRTNEEKEKLAQSRSEAQLGTLNKESDGTRLSESLKDVYRRASHLKKAGG